MLIVLSLGATFGALISGWLADRVGMMQVMIASGILFISCQVALIFHPPLWLLLLVYGAFGIAGSFNIILLAHTRRIFPANVTGRAISAVNLFGFGGVFVVQWLLGAIINRFPPDAAGHYPPEAYSAAFLFTAFGTLLCLLWYIPLARTPALVMQPKEA
ncbi:MAG: MFS transporter [Chloroflexaceae bacterium]|nr:MFS transporter [Chloroflexaceae bacterium]